MAGLILLNDTSDWYHWGCTATSTALKSKLRAHCESLDAVPINFTYGLNALPNSLESFDSSKVFDIFCNSNSEIVRRIESADSIFVNGEGTLHGVKPATIGLLYILYASRKFLGKDFSIINHSCYPESALTVASGGVADLLYRKVYSEAAFVAIREVESFELLKSMGLLPVLSFDCLPLWVRDNYRVQVSAFSNRVVLAGSVSYGQATISAYSELVQLLVGAGADVVVLTGASAYPAADDAEFVRRLYEQCPQGWSLVTASSLNEWMGCIASAQLLISGRFHHTIAAVSLGVPYIVMGSNTPKIQGLLSMLGNDQVIEHQDRELLSKLTRAVDERFGRRTDSSELLSALCELADLNFSSLR